MLEPHLKSVASVKSINRFWLTGRKSLLLSFSLAWFLPLSFVVFSLNFPIQSVAATEVFDARARVRYIEQSLDAFNFSSLKLLENTYEYIFIVANSECRSSIERLKLACLIQSAQRHCKTRPNRISRGRCEKYSDVLIVNKLAEEAFLNRSERFQIMKSGANYHTQLKTQLEYRYARLATQLHLKSIDELCDSKNNSCLAHRINSFCQSYSNQQNLSWQHCSGALVWFIGTAKQ